MPVSRLRGPLTRSSASAASLTVGAVGCNTNAEQAFSPGAGSNDLSGCPSVRLGFGTLQFTWNNYVNVASNYSSADYTTSMVGNGSVTSGAYARYGRLFVYQDKRGGVTEISDAFACDGIWYTNKSISPGWTMGFGATDITADRYEWMAVSSSCNVQEVGRTLFTIYYS